MTPYLLAIKREGFTCNFWGRTWPGWLWRHLATMQWCVIVACKKGCFHPSRKNMGLRIFGSYRHVVPGGAEFAGLRAASLDVGQWTGVGERENGREDVSGRTWPRRRENGPVWRLCLLSKYFALSLRQRSTCYWIFHSQTRIVDAFQSDVKFWGD